MSRIKIWSNFKGLSPETTYFREMYLFNGQTPPVILKDQVVTERAITKALKELFGCVELGYDGGYASLIWGYDDRTFDSESRHRRN